jgi:hypothetical protein
MIISKIQGGLGNQMFQYAYGKHLATKYNKKLYLDINFYQYQSLRKFSLQDFDDVDIDISVGKIKVDYPIYRVDDDFNYKELPTPNNCGYYLNGYWQSEKYFKESESVIKNNFKPNKNLFEKILKTPFIDTNTVSLHVRRTDYVTSNGYHPVQSIEYYKNAIDIIGDYDYIFVFSDDIQWCKDNLKFKNMVFMEGFSDIEDLHIMSLCQNNIIANSSFSWWGAWLNIHPEKKIIAPTNWFGEQANLNTSNMIPSDWIKINN